jgi:hypothetical protein
MGSWAHQSSPKCQLVIVDNGDRYPRVTTSASQTERPGMNRSTRARGSSCSATGGQSRPRATCHQAVLGSSVWNQESHLLTVRRGGGEETGDDGMDDDAAGGEDAGPWGVGGGSNGDGGGRGTGPGDGLGGVKASSDATTTTMPR